MERRHLRVVGQSDYPPGVERPRTRGDCRAAERPCPFVSCKWHLYLDLSLRGSIKFCHPGREPEELEDTCALDVADRGGQVLEEVGLALGVARERVRQIEEGALRKLGQSRVFLELAGKPTLTPAEARTIAHLTRSVRALGRLQYRVPVTTRPTTMLPPPPARDEEE